MQYYYQIFQQLQQNLLWNPIITYSTIQLHFKNQNFIEAYNLIKYFLSFDPQSYKYECFVEVLLIACKLILNNIAGQVAEAFKYANILKSLLEKQSNQFNSKLKISYVMQVKIAYTVAMTFAISARDQNFPQIKSIYDQQQPLKNFTFSKNQFRKQSIQILQQVKKRTGFYALSVDVRARVGFAQAMLLAESKDSNNHQRAFQLIDYDQIKLNNERNFALYLLLLSSQSRNDTALEMIFEHSQQFKRSLLIQIIFCELNFQHSVNEFNTRSGRGNKLLSKHSSDQLSNVSQVSLQTENNQNFLEGSPVQSLKFNIARSLPVLEDLKENSLENQKKKYKSEKNKRQDAFNHQKFINQSKYHTQIFMHGFSQLTHLQVHNHLKGYKILPQLLPFILQKCSSQSERNQSEMDSSQVTEIIQSERLSRYEVAHLARDDLTSKIGHTQDQRDASSILYHFLFEQQEFKLASIKKRYKRQDLYSMIDLMISRDPTNIENQVERIKMLQDDGQILRALTIAQTLMKQNPHSIELLHEIGKLYQACEEHFKAAEIQLSALKQVIKEPILPFSVVSLNLE